MESPRLSAAAREHLASDDHVAVISAVSAMEICLKHRLGKLSEAAPFIRDGILSLVDFDFESLAISFEHASLAGSLAIDHKDPFDRLLIAQSLAERIPLVSNETLFDGFGVERIW